MKKNKWIGVYMDKESDDSICIVVDDYTRRFLLDLACGRHMTFEDIKPLEERDIFDVSEFRMCGSKNDMIAAITNLKHGVAINSIRAKYFKKSLKKLNKALSK